jgi:hypothetical protein
MSRDTSLTMIMSERKKNCDRLLISRQEKIKTVNSAMHEFFLLATLVQDNSDRQEKKLRTSMAI